MNPRYGTQNSPTSILKLYTARIISYHWLSFLEAYSATHHICVCLCLTHVECFRFFSPLTSILFEEGLKQV